MSDADATSADRPVPAPSQRFARWVPAIALLTAAGFWAPAFRSPLATGFGDWQMVHHNWEVGYIALTRFAQWPLWNPFFCGGITAFGNPESQHFSPLVLLGLIFGTTIGTKLFIVLHAAAGLWGMQRFAQGVLRVRSIAACLVALVWGCSGFFAWHGAGGHATFLPFYLAPWLLLAWRRAELEPVYAIAVASLLAFVLMEGGTYPFPYFVLLLAFDALTRLRRARAFAIARAALAAAPLAFLLGAIRLLPVRAALARMPRLTSSDDALAWPDVLEMLTARDHAWRYPLHRFVWPEYGTFVGAGVVVLSALGLLVALRRRQLWVPAGLALFLLFMMGERGALYPWALLHHVPVFDSLRVPSRFAVLFTFYLACCAGLGLDAGAAWLQAWFTGRGVRDRSVLPAVLIVLLLGADIFYVNLQTIDRWDGPAIAKSAPAINFHLVGMRELQYQYATLPQKHLGTAGCYNGGMNSAVSPALYAGDVPQVRFSGRAQLQRFTRTLNTVNISVNAAEPTRMIVNQNFDPDWRSNLGQVVEDRGRLAVELPAGQHQIQLRYLPATLWTSLLLGALGIGLCATWLGYERRRHVR